ncbi:hypothetical protein CR194_16300 [Salipaludibacillus keqinensis]|uniref:Uncharacterized protein n=1 Tax=Salipaludibacillus keqinensis TaxID=2045207 RepID=A0A323TAY9_9BACI|nr:hypothetical protein [Salipaludibacillus keqinensis]PYZ92389.1 hypothetical protein CR194_16300 [Salipaludibacillus keqinensis]
MNLFTKTLLFGATSLVLVACGNDENNNNNNSADNNENETEQTDNTNVNVDDNNNNMNNDNLDSNNTNNEDNEGLNDNEANENEEGMENNASVEEDGDADTSELPVTVDHEAGDDELVFEKDGEEYSHSAEVYETDFGKEVKILEGMDADYEEVGNQTKAHFTVEDEDHEMYGLTFTVHEAFSYDGDEIMVSDVDVERSMTLESSLIENAGHVESFEAYEIEDDSTPFHYFFEVEGDASKPGQWSEAISGNDYKQYNFFEVVEEGRYIVTIQFPADADEEFEATALAMALSYGPEGTTADLDEEELVDEEDADGDE